MPRTPLRLQLASMTMADLRHMHLAVGLVNNYSCFLGAMNTNTRAKHTGTSPRVSCAAGPCAARCSAVKACGICGTTARFAAGASEQGVCDFRGSEDWVASMGIRPRFRLHRFAERNCLGHAPSQKLHPPYCLEARFLGLLFCLHLHRGYMPPQSTLSP